MPSLGHPFPEVAPPRPRCAAAERRPARLSWSVRLCGLPLLLLVVGCEGCRTDTGEEPDGENGSGGVAEAFTEELSRPIPSAEQEAQYAIKPGHWFTATKPLRANRGDERGELRVSTGTLRLPRGGLPGPLEARRPVVLPEGQLKRLDFRLLAAIPEQPDTRLAYLRDPFFSDSGGLAFDRGKRAVQAMPPEEYFFLVLTTRPSDFVSLQVADWVSPPTNQLVEGRRRSHYRVVFPAGDNVLPLPETLFDWTSTAFLLWDDVSPDRLTPAQQQAIEDWVHWGGRVIINGPAAGQALAGSELAEVMPLRVDRATELDGSSLAALLEAWSVPKDDTTAPQVALANSGQSRVAVDGAVHPQAKAIGETADLVLERRVGLGNVVMTRFDLTSKILLNWRSVQSFYNNALLRHPPRQFIARPEAPLRIQYLGLAPQTRVSPLLTSSVRFFNRDGVLAEPAQEGIREAEDAALATVSAPATGGPATGGPATGTEKAAEKRRENASSVAPATNPVPLTAWQVPGTLSHPLSGAAAWTDRSDTALAVLQMLREEAGIVIPPASFVARSLFWYLLVLVPINFLVFRLIRRLEWAWIAVPLLSIGGAMWVARAARLDIGFARANTEIGLLEMQPGYDRGHLASYIALYNSLSSTYELSFDTGDAAAAPARVVQAEETESSPIFRYGFDRGPSLSGVTVASNRMRLMHSEQVIEAAGPISLSEDGSQLVNASSLALTDAHVVMKDDAGKVQVAMVGLVDPGVTVGLQFASQEGMLPVSGLPLQLGRLLFRIGQGSLLRPGEARLVARVEACPTALTITPTAQQQQRETVLLAHLRHAPIPAAAPDRSLIPSAPAEPLLDDFSPLDSLDASDD